MLRRIAPAALLLLVGAAPAPDAWTWEGRYAMDLRIATVTRVPLAGSERSTTRTLLLVEMAKRGGGWVQHQTVCDVTIQSARIRMTVPAAFIAAMPPREYTGIAQSAADPRAYSADLGLEAIGFDPALTGGTLPRDGRARGVVDSDGDGAPGATVVGHFPMFGRVRLFIAQRSHLVLRGRQTAPGRFEGGMDIRLMEQRTLGADHRLFRRTLPMRADAQASRFTMLRTTAATCAEVRGEAARLFGA